MIPLKQTPEEQQAGWADYRQRRYRALLGVLSLPLFFCLQGAITRYLPMVSVAWIGAIGAFLLLMMILFLVYPLLRRWMEWKCPRCGSSFGLMMGSDQVSSSRIDILIVLWRLVFSKRCGHCRKPAIDRDLKTNSTNHAPPTGKLIRWDSDTGNDGR